MDEQIKITAIEKFGYGFLMQLERYIKRPKRSRECIDHQYHAHSYIELNSNIFLEHLHMQTQSLIAPPHHSSMHEQ